MNYQNELNPGNDLPGSTILSAPAGDPAQQPATQAAQPDPAPAAAAQPDPAQQPATQAAADPWWKTAPADWREQIANGDEKKLNQLKRVKDFGTFAENYFNAQDKIRSGEIKSGLPENPTEEQLATYREIQGIPQKPEEYDLKLEEGVVLGEADKRIMDSIYPIAHKHNVPAAVLSELTNQMLKGQEQQLREIETQDGLDFQTAERQLRDTWRHDYDMNVNVVKGLLNSLPESVRGVFMDSRLADGRLMFNSPEVMNFFADVARTVNPAATVVPSGTGNPIQAINDRIADLEKRMGTKEWYNDMNSQQEYQRLVEAKSKMQ
jgi:hypothetical protein